MKSFELTEQKDFMNRLLCSPLFDNFLLSEASIHSAVNYEINGHLNPGFYSEEELAEQQLEGLSFLPYGRLRPVFFELIRGKHAPSFMKFVLQLSPEHQKKTVSASGTSIPYTDITAVYLNIVYQNEMLRMTTGVSYRYFVLDKSFEREWERYAENFLKKNGIVFT